MPFSLHDRSSRFAFVSSCRFLGKGRDCSQSSFGTLLQKAGSSKIIFCVFYSCYDSQVTVPWQGA